MKILSKRIAKTLEELEKEVSGTKLFSYKIQDYLLPPEPTDESKKQKFKRMKDLLGIAKNAYKQVSSLEKAKELDQKIFTALKFALIYARSLLGIENPLSKALLADASNIQRLHGGKMNPDEPEPRSGFLSWLRD
jgi:hypothetical protein